MISMSQALQAPVLKWMIHGDLIRAQVTIFCNSRMRQLLYRMHRPTTAPATYSDGDQVAAHGLRRHRRHRQGHHVQDGEEEREGEELPVVGLDHGSVCSSPQA